MLDMFWKNKLFYTNIAKTLGEQVYSKKCIQEHGFNLVQIKKEGKGSTVIFIDGFLSADNAYKTRDWESQLEKLYPDNPWTCLMWNAKSVKDIQKNLAKHLGAYSLGPEIGLPIHLFLLFKNSWRGALVNAQRTGKHLADSLEEVQFFKKSFILCGHSLGARVIFYALEALASKNMRIIEDVHLLGGAVGNKKDDWKNAKKSVTGTITNYKCKHDQVLSKGYTAGTFFTSDPIGLYDINVEGVINIDCSSIVTGHMEYKSNFAKIANI